MDKTSFLLLAAILLLLNCPIQCLALRACLNAQGRNLPFASLGRPFRLLREASAMQKENGDKGHRALIVSVYVDLALGVPLLALFCIVRFV